MREKSKEHGTEEHRSAASVTDFMSRKPRVVIILKLCPCSECLAEDAIGDESEPHGLAQRLHQQAHFECEDERFDWQCHNLDDDATRQQSVLGHSLFKLAAITCFGQGLFSQCFHYVITGPTTHDPLLSTAMNRLAVPVRNLNQVFRRVFRVLGLSPV